VAPTRVDVKAAPFLRRAAGGTIARVNREILGQFARFRRRHVWVRGRDLFLEAAYVMTVTAGAMLLVDRLAFELGLAAPHLSSPAMLAATLGGTLAIAMLVAAAVVLLRPTPPAEIAWRVDRAAGGEERVLSALELAVAGDGRGPFAQALCKDAVRIAERASPRRVLPHVRIGYRWGIALSLAVGGLLYAWPPQLYDAPMCDFEASPLRGPASLEVAFRDGSIGAIDEFRWEFGDGQEGFGEGVTHVYEKPGRYTARLLLRGPGGASSKSREIEVLPSDRSVADFAAKPLKGRIPLEVRFENLSKNAKAFFWEFGDGATSTEPDPVHAYAQAGYYDIHLTVANDIGKDEKVRAKYIKASHPDEPLANFAALPREGNAPLTVDFEDRTAGAVDEWHWDFGDLRSGDGNRSAERNPNHVYRSPGHYTVRLRVKGPHGEDEDEKVRFIHVKDSGEGPGGGGGGAKPKTKPPPDPKKNPGGAGKEPGRDFGDPPPPKPYKFDDADIKSHKPGEASKIEAMNVLTPNPTTPGGLEEKPLKTVLPQYQRAAEESMSQERIPPALRDYVRRVYEDLQQKSK
jgi:PKD repeat protein